MSPSAPPVREEQLALDHGPVALVRALRRTQPIQLFFDGRGGFEEGWRQGSLVALRPSVQATGFGPQAQRLLPGLGDLVARRRRSGGTASTGVAALLAYEFSRPEEPEDDGCRLLPSLVVFSVDASLGFANTGEALLTVRGDEHPGDDAVRRTATRLRSRVEGLDSTRPSADPARRIGRVRTSLPREAYLRAVEQVRRLIARGEIYQANLSQRFSAAYRGDAFELYARLVDSTPAPHSAFIETPQLTVASASPETFLRTRSPGTLETIPIKGTRARGRTPGEDRAAARSLRESPKDRAELLMIVDLERNDLSRVCMPGTVRVPELCALRSYAAVHHLVARVEGRLRRGTSVEQLIRATFPGGSISGAPKIRAMQILRDLEPVPRSFFTGSLFWFGDDGSLDSSILIRSLVFDGGRVLLGAGGGVVADSRPEGEWHESNHKARALAAVLGFEPEEAT